MTYLQEQQLLGVVRHAPDVLDGQWKEAKKYAMMKVPGHGPEKNIPPIQAGLNEFKTLVEAICRRPVLATMLADNKPISFCSSCKLRAQKSAETMHAQLLKSFPKVWIDAIRYCPELDGRNYGFTWARTLNGLKVLLRNKKLQEELQHLELDPFTFRPWGGENWVDVISRVFRFIHEVVMRSRNHIFLMTHHELVPIIEELLIGGLVPGPLTINAAAELPNATVNLWVRDLYDKKPPGPWRRHSTVTGHGYKDYSAEQDVREFLTQPKPSPVTDLNEYRARRKEIRRQYVA